MTRYSENLVAHTYLRTDKGMVYVSTITSRGGSAPLGEPADFWKGETCAWPLDPETGERGERLCFGPDYHGCDVDQLLDRHIEAVQAVRAGHHYISDWQDSMDEAVEGIGA